MNGMRTWQLVELALLLVPGFLVLWRVRLLAPGGRGGSARARRPAARVRGSEKEAFSVIIPARDEEERLPPLLRSLEIQTVRPREIIVVNDGSRDRTARVARDAGCRVVAAGRRPRGWLGKTWA
ncbi:MAG TPA: glycosyltransferase, partial [Spirochaetia bacterium]|nr:glycosyltransferase [Spirochaetia bacterium]